MLARAYKAFGGEDLKNAVDKVLDNLLPQTFDTVAETSFLLLALSDLPDNDPRRELMRDLAETLWRSVELPHGRISTHYNPDDPSPSSIRITFLGKCCSRSRSHASKT